MRNVWPFLFLIFPSCMLATPCDSLLNAGDSSYVRFANQQALGAYKKALGSCKNKYEPLMKAARAYNDIGEDLNSRESGLYFDSALSFAGQLKTEYPDSVQGYFLSSAAAGNKALGSGGKSKVVLSRTVEKNAQKAIALDPNYAPAHVILGTYYREVAKANRFLKAIARMLWGKLPNGTIQDSLRELRLALRLEPDNMHGHFQIAKTYLAAGDKKFALQHFQMVLSLPNSDNQSEQMKREAKERIGEIR